MKDKILDNLNTSGIPKLKFLREHELSTKQCYNIVHLGDASLGIKCQHCDSDARFISFLKGYAPYCGMGCRKGYKWSGESKEAFKEKRKIFWETNADKLQERNKKLSETNKKVWGSGTELRIKQTELVDFKDVNAKGRKTKKEKYGNENYMGFGTKENEAIIKEKYGVNNVRLIEGMTERIQATYLEKYGVKNAISLEGVREKGLKIRRNNYMDKIGDVSQLGYYRRQVMRFTLANDFSGLDNYDKRGRSGVEGAYQLDHKFSVIEGYLQNIPPWYIGSIHNLEMIPWIDNIKKRDKCSIDLETLCASVSNSYDKSK